MIESNSSSENSKTIKYNMNPNSGNKDADDDDDAADDDDDDDDDDRNSNNNNNNNNNNNISNFTYTSIEGVCRRSTFHCVILYKH